MMNLQAKKWTALSSFLLVNAVLPSQASMLEQLKDAPNPLKFVVLADLHIVPGNDNDRIFQQVRQQIDSEGYDYVFVAGDLTNQGNNEELDNVFAHLKQFETPYYAVPGNHETTWSESACKRINELWGNDRFLFEKDGYIFCGINTGPFMRMSDGHVKAEDLLWLDTELSKYDTKAKQVIFFSHYPMQDGLGNFPALTAVLRKHNCQISFCGHEHRFKHINSDSIPQVVCHALYSREKQLGYTSVEMDAKRARCYYHLLGHDKPVDSMYIDLGYTDALLDKQTTLPNAEKGGVMPRGWKVKKLHQESASLFTGINAADDVMVYGTSEGDVIARSITTNKELWRHHTGHSLFSTPLFYEQLVIVPTTSNSIIALDQNTGAQLWEVACETPVTGDGTIAGENLYIGAGSGVFMSLHLPTGKVNWQYDGVRDNARMQGAPAVTDKYVVFGAWDSYLYCLNIADGSLAWKWNNGREVDLIGPGNVVPVVRDNRVLIVAPDRYLTIIDLETGKTVYRTKEYKVRESLAYSDATGKAYAKTMDGELLSFTFPADELQGEVVTDLTMGYEHNPCPAFEKDGIVYSGSRGGVVSGMRASDNQFLFRFKCGNSSVLRFTEGPNGTVLANLTEGSVWQFAPGDPQFITNEGQEVFSAGLSGKHIAMWPSHGYYYDRKQDRWYWQRARCFGSVEDISIFSYVQPFIAPMMENAGAYVMMPRERDTQTNEIIIDNDKGRKSVKYSDVSRKNRKTGAGFAPAAVWADGTNPFTQGTHIAAPITQKDKPQLRYNANIEEAGDYAVYISYADVPEGVKARYVVHHAGGSDSFIVDQNKGGGLFHYLGTFAFAAGDKQPVVEISAADASLTKGVLTSDAIRLGGGMGNVAVEGVVSEMPRYTEAARYFLQYTGVPDSIYSQSGFKNDYTDDYKSRGVWVNHLIEKDIPVDGVLAFHTDAGITQDDRIIGTLAICSTKKGSLQGMMSDTMSYVMSREIQNQLVQDIRALCNEEWTQRELWDKTYYEAWTPEAPALLLELLSHQNLADMRYGLDPRFRFIVSRAIYKAMGRFVTSLHGEEFVVQPLPPHAFGMEQAGGKKLNLRWAATPDPLEESATSKSYHLYVREAGKGWQAPITVSGNQYTYELPAYGKRYDFKVTALNDGGESFDTEVLSAYLTDAQQKPALIVNAFERVAAPAFFDSGDKAGIAWWEDEGVPYQQEASFVGYQYDFDRSSPWISDDCPGWGASDVSGWGKKIAGNSFDFPMHHGKAFEAVGQSYISTSRKAFEQGEADPADYAMLDLILGEQREMPNFAKDDTTHGAIFTAPLQEAIAQFTEKDKPMLISGAYIANDLLLPDNQQARTFAKETLGIRGVSGNAAKQGAFVPAAQAPSTLTKGAYNTELSPTLYRVESPCAIAPADETAVTVYRYPENRLSAGVYGNERGKQLILGFPFESILDVETQKQMLELLLR